MKIFLIPLLMIIYISDVFPKPSSQLDTIIKPPTCDNCASYDTIQKRCIENPLSAVCYIFGFSQPSDSPLPSTDADKWRNDSYCGVGLLAPNGRRAECNPESWSPCCDRFGRCKSYGCTGYNSADYRSESTACYFGTTYDAIQKTCVDDPICQLPLIPQPIDPQASSMDADRGKWRNDSRCSSTFGKYSHFRAPNGEPAQCNPEGLSPCCSEYGWCGGSCAHCRCRLCIDYRDHETWAGYDHCYTYDNIHKKWVGDQSCIDDPCDHSCLVYDNTEQDCV